MTRAGGGVWAQTIYYPFEHASKYGRGISLRTILDTPKHDTTNFTDVPMVDCAATLGDDGIITIFAVNRDMEEDALLTCDLRAFGDVEVTSHTVMHHDDMNAANTEELPDTVLPYDVTPDRLDDGIHLPAASWNVIRIKVK